MKVPKQRPSPFATQADIPKTYRELCQLYLPRPIHDDSEDAEATYYMLALAVFERLNREQQDYLDVLTEFVDEYDKRLNIKWPKVTGVDMHRTHFGGNVTGGSVMSMRTGIASEAG